MFEISTPFQARVDVLCSFGLYLPTALWDFPPILRPILHAGNAESVSDGTRRLRAAGKNRRFATQKQTSRGRIYYMKSTSKLIKNWL